MKQEIKDRWVARLRDPDSKQTQGALRRGDGRCCLGILCDIAVEDGIIIAKPSTESGQYPEVMEDTDEITWFYGPQHLVEEYMLSDATLPREVMEWAGMTTASGDFRRPSDEEDLEYEYVTLIELNDDFGADFPTIADAIEENWEKL